MMIKNLIRIVISVLFFSCSNAQNGDNIHIFIPINYTGWVNIVFNDSTSSAEPLKFSDGYVFLITGNPTDFKIKSEEFPPGRYNMYYYYYSLDTTIKLSWLGYPKKNIFFEGTIELNNGRIPRMSTFTFYVSKEPLNINGLSRDDLEKNKILQ
jgi:hypothetical protein